ncbi:MAG: hypothetical protein HY547_03290 [Elusimicrobia bacterium]|nr:hypothetical protein [Elusimicrobiota bacterium]
MENFFILSLRAAAPSGPRDDKNKHCACIMRDNGQILVPSLFVFPGLVLFAILIVEVAKLSQQKILHQFAMDTAVMMEASQASDMANRMAYLNSPWPTRIFQAEDDAFEVLKWNTNGKGPCSDDPCFAWQYLLKNGVYPGSIEAEISQQPSIPVDATEDDLGGDPWHGEFRSDDSDNADAQARTVANTASPPTDLGTWVLFSKEDIEKGLAGQVMSEDASALYQQVGEVYGYFYSLSSMVRLVYEKLNKVFFKKTFWLNTGFTPDDDLAPSSLQIQDHCSTKITSYFTVMIEAGGVEIPDTRYWKPQTISFGGKPLCRNGTGIWQLSTVPDLASDDEHTFNFGKFYYEGPANHFGIDYKDLFEGYEPHVTASAEVSGGRVWPEPKPSFQVRLRP